MGRSGKTKRNGRPAERDRVPDEAADSRRFNWLEHAGAVIGLFSLAAIAFRVLIVSDYSTETARALIQETGAVNVGLGAMVELLPVAASFAWGAGIVMQLDHAYRKRTTSPVPWLGITLLSTIGAGLAPLMSAGAFFVLALFMWRWYYLGESLGERWRPVRGPGMALIATICAIMLLYGIASRDPWLAAERIEIQGRPPFTAYVLTEEHGTMSMLRDEPRTIMRVDRDLVRNRAICSVEEEIPAWLTWIAWTQYPLARLMVAGTEPTYPACPSSPR